MQHIVIKTSKNRFLWNNFEIKADSATKIKIYEPNILF